MEITDGDIIQMDERGVLIAAACPDIDRAILRQYKKVLIALPDGRRISPDQRRKAHAIIKEISDWMGDLPAYVKRLMKMEFIVNRLKALERQMFSLSDCDMTTAREFITYLIDFCVEHDVPCRVPLYELCEDIGKYVYACLMHKKCAVCGKNGADLHHFDQVGMGRDREEICHIGMRVISLCREHHNIAHDRGKTWLTEDMHLLPVELDDAIARKYRLTKKQRGRT